MAKRKSTITKEVRQSGNQEENVEANQRAGTQFTTQSVFRAALGLQNLETDDEIVLVDPVTNAYFQLNSTGRYIWWLVVQRQSLGDIADQLAQRFDLSSERAFQETSSFVQVLVERGLAVPVSQHE